MQDSDKLKINLSVLGQPIPIHVLREEEENYRCANTMVNQAIESYRKQFAVYGEDTTKYLSMACINFAYRYVKMSKDKDMRPIEDFLEKINADLEAYMAAEKANSK